MTAHNCSHVALFTIANASTSVWLVWTEACQLTAFCSTAFELEAHVDEVKGTHGDSGAGLNPPPAAKLIMLPCFLRNAALIIKPYGISSTTRDNTSGSSHHHKILTGWTTLVLGLAALDHPCPLGLITDCPPLPLRSTERTNAAEE